MLLTSAPLLSAAPRTWTTAAGPIEAEYLNSTADTVTVRAVNGQAMRLKLSEVGEADRSFVAEKQAAAKQANQIEASIHGDIVWRLPTNWSSLSIGGGQEIEIWLWDDRTRTPTVKLADTKADYTINIRTRNQYEGNYATTQPVTISKNAWVIVKAKLKTSVNGKQKSLEELSVPMSLPAANKGVIKLPTVRLSVNKVS